MTERKKRAYSSPSRRESAEATRLRIVDAAREVLLEQGYARTTMAQVAARAGVAVPTLYAASPGGKAALARTVYDVTLAGDAQPITQAERPEVQAIIDEPDPARKLHLFAAMAAGINGRIGPMMGILRAAAGTDPDAAELVERAEEQRRRGSRGPATHLDSLGLLRAGLSMESAADQFYVLTASETMSQLVDRCGWTVDEYRDWLAGVLVRTIIA